MTQQRPQAFGRYEILERISAGGMAEVFKARDTRRGIMVALKKLLPQVAEDEEFIEMFEDEAQIVSQLEHPHIARNLDYGREGNTYYIAFEYVNGKDLRRVYEHAVKAREHPPLSYVLYVIARVGEGLAYAHARKDKLSNLVHRDVSPQNIVISFDGDVKLIDFGIAKAAGKLGRTRVGTIKGKFGYMSPEQVRGDDVTQQTDVFSLGICLWEILTLKRLFHAENELLVLEKIRNLQVEPPSTHNPGIPPNGRAELDRIVLKALANSLDERYRSAKEFYRDLNVLAQTINAVATRGDIATYMRRVFLEASGAIPAPQPAFSSSLSKPSTREVQETFTMAADNKGSDLDIFEGLAKKTSQPAPSGPSARPPGPPSADPGKKTLLGIAAPPPIVPPPRQSQAGPPPAAPPAARPITPPPNQVQVKPPSQAGMDMDWDDDDEATHIFDKETDRPSEGARPAAGMPAAGAPPPSLGAAPRSSALPGVPSGMRAANAPPPPPGTAPGGFQAAPAPPPGMPAPPPGMRSAPPPPNPLPPPTIDPIAAPPPPPPQNNFGMTMPLGGQPPPPPPGMMGPAMAPPGMMGGGMAPPPPPGNMPMAFQQTAMSSGAPMMGAAGGVMGPAPVPQPMPVQAQPQHQSTMPPQQMPLQPHEVRRMEATALVRPPSSSKAPIIILLLLVVLGGLGAAAFFLIPRTGRVQVSVTDSKGASLDRVDVFVDGKPQCQTAPCTIDAVAAGNHDLKVIAQGYDAQTKTVTVERGKDAQVAFQLAGGSKGTGLKVTGTQPGVKLLIDGNEIGQLPQELKDLTAGDHKVKFVGPCGDPPKDKCTERYAAMEQSVSLSKDEIRDMGSITLKVVKGKATITLGTPGAKVNLVSGSERRDLPQFPISVDIDTSKQWTLEATKIGYTDYKQPISFDDGMAEKVFNVTLEQKGLGVATNNPPIAHTTTPVNTGNTGNTGGGDATVTLNSVPPGKVVLDGKPLGDTPQKGIKVSPGNHNALFVNSEQELKKSCPFTIAAGETKVVICKLKE